MKKRHALGLLVLCLPALLLLTGCPPTKPVPGERHGFSVRGIPITSTLTDRAEGLKVTKGVKADTGTTFQIVVNMSNPIEDDAGAGDLLNIEFKRADGTQPGTNPVPVTAPIALTNFKGQSAVHTAPIDAGSVTPGRFIYTIKRDDTEGNPLPAITGEFFIGVQGTPRPVVYHKVSTDLVLGDITKGQPLVITAVFSEQTATLNATTDQMTAVFARVSGTGTTKPADPPAQAYSSSGYGGKLFFNFLPIATDMVEPGEFTVTLTRTFSGKVIGTPTTTKFRIVAP